MRGYDLVLRPYVSDAVLKMNAKLEWEPEVYVEGQVDMMVVKSQPIFITVTSFHSLI